MAATVNPHSLQNIKWLRLLLSAVYLYTCKVQSAVIVMMEFLALCLRLRETILIALVPITFMALCVLFLFVFSNGIKCCFL